MNSNLTSKAVAGYIKRHDTFSKDRQHCKNPRGCGQIFFSLSIFERVNLLSKNLTEYDLAYIEKSDECPPCVLERRFGLRLAYDQYRTDNFSETMSKHICGGCREPFKIVNMSDLIVDLQSRRIGTIEKINRVDALMRDTAGKGRCKKCAVEQIEKETEKAPEGYTKNVV